MIETDIATGEDVTEDISVVKNKTDEGLSDKEKELALMELEMKRGLRKRLIHYTGVE